MYRAPTAQAGKSSGSFRGYLRPMKRTRRVKEGLWPAPRQNDDQPLNQQLANRAVALLKSEAEYSQSFGEAHHGRAADRCAKSWQVRSGIWWKLAPDVGDLLRWHARRMVRLECRHNS